MERRKRRTRGLRLQATTADRPSHLLERGGEEEGEEDKGAKTSSDISNTKLAGTIPPTYLREEGRGERIGGKEEGEEDKEAKTSSQKGEEGGREERRTRRLRLQVT
jgi:hypothetical protein